MNNVSIVGRLCADPELNYIRKGKDKRAIANMRVAIQRTYKNEDGEYDADFISVSAFGSTAEFVDEYFNKGDKIGIIGRLSSSDYEKDGARVYTVGVLADRVEFVSDKKDDGTAGKKNGKEGKR